MTLDEHITEVARAAVREELARWELAQPRPRMIPVKEAAELLSVSDEMLRKLEPRLPITIDRTGMTHAVSSVHVYALIEAGGIAAVLDKKPALRKSA